MVSEIPEHSTLERFGRVVANHIPCGTLNYRHFTILNPIGDKEIPNVNVLFTFSDKFLPNLLQNNGTIVGLVQEIISNIVPFGFFCVDILFFGANNWESTPQR